ncbi:hypothetical protein [Ancylobacter oerskovii]|uniref:Uncharacterized protein n=1 Tax=Ancylobacter oerskovii TaxID=459519 RepID=A0ABW4YV07_9HYPH|nr:hypothetical protein [Ancylobacter oerskovii]MBS7544331.1 hypothetical protein [Ancylobacter oerskovii]
MDGHALCRLKPIKGNQRLAVPMLENNQDNQDGVSWQHWARGISETFLSVRALPLMKTALSERSGVKYEIVSPPSAYRSHVALWQKAKSRRNHYQ